MDGGPAALIHPTKLRFCNRRRFPVFLEFVPEFPLADVEHAGGSGLVALQVLQCGEDQLFLDLPGWRLHPLKGELNEYWSMSVSGNWRIIFRFTGPDIELVDYLDYH